MTRPMPVVFFGHGNPMNALASNDWTKGWAKLGQEMPRPAAVISVSAHWYVPGVSVTAMTKPLTIHDFGGFPQELYQVEYPAPGHPELAAHVRDLLAPVDVTLDHNWGLDHGTWAVLCHVFPDADVPVVQLSLDRTQPASFHHALGKRLASLRDEGVLIIGSGNLVHNLQTYGWGRTVAPYEWAVRFEERARRLMVDGELEPLVDYESMGDDARLSIPTPEHYLPLLYVLALGRDSDEVSFPVEGIEGGSVSMLSVRIG